MATDLFEQPPLLNDVRNGFLLDAASFVDVLEGVEILRLLVLDNPDLQWRAKDGGMSTEKPPAQKMLHRPSRKRPCLRSEGD